jgi:hypothetical protein
MLSKHFRTFARLVKKPVAAVKPADPKPTFQNLNQIKLDEEIKTIDSL